MWNITKPQPMPEQDLLMPNGKGGFLRFTDHLRIIPISQILPGTDQDPDYAAGTADTASIHTGREYPVQHTQKRGWQNMTGRNTHTTAIC